MSEDQDGPQRTRRRLLATGASSVAALLGGCFSYGGGGNADASVGKEELTTASEATIVEEEHGADGSVRTVRHTPSSNLAYVEGAISVPRELKYEVRLGVIDQNGVVLAQRVVEQLLYPTGTNLVSAELQVDDCESCHSGLVDVSLTPGALRELEQEQEQEQQEQQQQREERMNEQQQNQSRSNATAGGTTVPANETAGGNSSEGSA